ADDVNFTAGGYSLRNASRRRPYLSLITGVVDYRPTSSLRFSVGKQIVNWSNFDEIQPANLMTPRDESDIFRRVELGVPSVSVHYEAGVGFADLVVVPLAFTPSRLPQGRWNILHIDGTEEIQDQTPVRLNETQAGARLVARLDALQAGLIGYVGRDTDAIFVPNLIYIGGPQLFRLQIIDTFPQLRAGGITTSYDLGEQTLLRMESVYYNSPDRRQADYLQTAAGVEYSFADWRMVLNYLHHDHVVEAPEPVTNKGERHFFRSFLFGELRYDAGGNFQAQLRGGYDATERFLLLGPEISYRVWRQLRIALVGNFIDADRPSYFKTVQQEDRIGTRWEYAF
ncbi:MAG TPA: hypothetical protein VMT89_06430, partial [Candidatus Acidoferrales bacterium]|nr:hypothetical protein [Candidatus Acidoferrales bacterium]